MNAGARWYRIGSAITCETAGGSGVGPAVIRYCLLKTMGRPRITVRFAGKPANRFAKGSGLPTTRASRDSPQAEGRIAVRHQPLPVRVHSHGPAKHAGHEVEHSAG